MPSSTLPVKKRRESLGPQRAAEVLGVSKQTIYRMIRRGDIPAYRVGWSLRITVANLLAYRRANRVLKALDQDRLPPDPPEEDHPRAVSQRPGSV